jgi:streptogramin lyase
MIKRILGIILAIFLFVPTFVRGEDASDIVVPPGFRVEKVLETNKCVDPLNIAFLPSGDLLVASMMWRIYQVSSSGTVSTRAKFLTNKGPNPFDILVTPVGEIYFSHTDQWSNPGLYRLEYGQPVLVTPQGWQFDYFTRDGDGNFYAVARSVPGIGREVVKISDPNGDGQYEDVKPLIVRNAQGVVYRDGFLYIVTAAGRILKFDTDGSQIGGHIIEGLNSPRDLAMDSDGNLYTIVYDGQIIDGYGSYDKWDVIKISPDGTTPKTIVDDVKGSLYISLDPDNVLYLSEIDRGVVSKVVNGDKIDVTEDTGHGQPSDIAFDMLNQPYISLFRFSQLKRLDPETRTLEAVTPALGAGTQTIGVDNDGRFYLSEYNNNGFFIVDPLSGTVENRTVPWSRTLRFDAYGRLVLIQNSVTTGPTSDDTSTTLGIYDLTAGVVTPYIAGNDLMRFLFDKSQNMYARYRRWEGIIKVNVPEAPTDPPFSTNGVPLFYNLKSKNSEIRYFDLNVNGQLLIPLVDTGEIILGETDGSWKDFASGFDWPGYVRFDRNGVLYVVDDGVNGVFRIIGQSFVVPTVIQRLHDLEIDIRAKVKDGGLANSLYKKIDNAIALLNNGNIVAAINQMKAFINEVEAQKGKKIPSSVAESFIIGAGTIIAGLKLL